MSSQRSSERLNGVLFLDAFREDVPEEGSNIPEGPPAVSLRLRIPGPENIKGRSRFMHTLTPSLPTTSHALIHCSLHRTAIVRICACVALSLYYFILILFCCLCLFLSFDGSETLIKINIIGFSPGTPVFPFIPCDVWNWKPSSFSKVGSTPTPTPPTKNQ